MRSVASVMRELPVPAMYPTTCCGKEPFPAPSASSANNAFRANDESRIAKLTTGKLMPAIQ